MKICKNGDFRHISGIFSRKKNFSKIGHILGIINTHLCVKKSEKNYDEMSRKSPKTGFSDIFPAFSAENFFFFQKSGSVTFWALPFCIFEPKIRKN